MTPKQFVLTNRGMNRDLSIPNTGNSSNAWENVNVRIEAREDGTLLSVTNEKGTKNVAANNNGGFVGANVLGDYLILFTTTEIARYKLKGNFFSKVTLFTGDIGLRRSTPIESVVYYESESVQKIYWVDGIHPLRMMNFMATEDERAKWTSTSFDVNLHISYGVKATITKDNSGVTRSNGTIQYLLTYYDEHGSESAVAWMSDLVYLSPLGRGGSEDGTNSNKVSIVFKAGTLDTTHSNFRIYSLFRSSQNGAAVAYLVSEQKTSTEDVTVVDDGAHLASVDTTSLLYLGSKNVIAGTIAHKDQVLFLGNLQSTGVDDSAIESILHTVGDSGVFKPANEETEFTWGTTWESNCITFRYSGDIDTFAAIDCGKSSDIYPYNSQLQKTSSEILTFKGGEKYRFALKFRLADGTETNAFWIGDAVNPLYPKMDSTGVAQRVIAQCTLPSSVAQQLEDEGIVAGQLMIAEATEADRSVIAQGIVNPTVFSMFEREQNRLYAMPSWITRPRGSGFANRHFSVIESSNSKFGEIQCNWWDSTEVPYPYIKYTYSSTAKKWSSQNEISDNKHTRKLAVVYEIRFTSSLLHFYYDVFYSLYEQTTDENKTLLGFATVITSDAIANHGKARRKAYNSLRSKLLNSTLHTYVDRCLVNYTTFASMCGVARKNADEWFYFSGFKSPVTTKYDELASVLNDTESWNTVSDTYGVSDLSYIQKNLMFVDENVVTLDSPELTYGGVQVDNLDCKFRIIGIAKMHGTFADYSVDATHALASGTNLNKLSLSGLEKDDTGILSRPLWQENKLNEKKDSADTAVEDRDSDDYTITSGGGIVSYWLNMWHSAGSITKFANTDYLGHSELNSKVFANMQIAYETIYADGKNARAVNLAMDNIRELYDSDGSLATLRIGDTDRYVSGMPDTLLTMPDDKKYPVLYAFNSTDKEASGEFLYSSDPVQVAYKSGTEAIISLKTKYDTAGEYIQTILPHLTTADGISNPDSTKEKHFLPWLSEESIPACVNKIFTPTEENGAEVVSYDSTAKTITSTIEVDDQDTGDLLDFAATNYDPFYIILTYTDTDKEQWACIVDASGIIYSDGTATLTSANVIARSRSDLSLNCTCIEKSDAVYTAKTGNLVVSGTTSTFTENASGLPDTPAYLTHSELLNLSSDGERYLFVGELYREFGDNDTRYGGITENAVANNIFIPAGDIYNIELDTPSVFFANQGDTYFQRYNALRIKPSGTGAVNGVIDIVSALLETHINLDGNTTVQKDLSNLASIDTANYGHINMAYSQANNFITATDIPSSVTSDSYKSTIAWTLPKSDLAQTDEWTHITLLNTLNLDADKGECRKLVRYGNSLLAFQDKGIAEILFNSRTQLTTQEGVPVEIANSGKVEGKRYLTEKYGCLNKWSIVECKNGLYFVDDLNKAFCNFNGQLSVLSSKLGFDTWFRKYCTADIWDPFHCNGFISFYDKVHNDVYLCNRRPEYPCLVYNENLDAFTSFFNYDDVMFMANIQDKFVAIHNPGDPHFYFMNEGITNYLFNSYYPSKVTYRVAPEPVSDKIWTNADVQVDFFDSGDSYLPDEMFDSFEVWNEYQHGSVTSSSMNPIKKFRTWRYTIPRANKSDTNKFGLDRIHNPWVFMKFEKEFSSKHEVKMVLHDVNVKYFE